jgi:hypothetical protein
MRLSPRALVFTILGLILLLSGCASIKAEPSKGAGFVPVDQMAKREDLPFQKAWIKAGVDWKRYTTIYIRGVRTDYLLEANWWQQGSRRGQIKEDLARLARFMQWEFKQACRNDPHNRLRVVETPQKGSLTLELALTELVPSHVVLQALGYAPYGAGAAVRVLEKTTGAETTVAFEARVRDTNTGATLAMFADRESKKIAPIDLKGLTWYGHIEDIIKEWAEQFVHLANKRPGEIIKPSSPFTLRPW